MRASILVLKARQVRTGAFWAEAQAVVPGPRVCPNGFSTKKAAHPTRVGCQLLVIAGVLVAAGLWLLPLVAAMLLPDGLTLDEAGTIFLGGSLGTAILFFAPPLLLLAMLSPLLV